MTAVFRVDASGQIGAGHVMRCLALAGGMMAKGCRCIFICKDYPGNLINVIKNKGFEVEVMHRDADISEDLRLSVQICRKQKVDILITDSYDITENYLSDIKKEIKVLASIDENALQYFPTDILLNQNFGVKKEDYHGKVAPDTKLLLGSDFALLREEFREKSQNKREIVPSAEKVLISMGGGDPNNQILKVLKALRTLPGLMIKTVIGHAYSHMEALKTFLKDNPMKVDLVENCQQMSDLMLWADVAISAGGSTCWELACLGVPTVTIIEHENQKRVVDEPGKRGVLIHLGWQKDVDEDDIKKSVAELCSDYRKRKQMSERGKRLVDGRGVQRVIKEIFHSFNLKNQRPIKPNDCKTLKANKIIKQTLSSLS